MRRELQDPCKLPALTYHRLPSDDIATLSRLVNDPYTKHMLEWQGGGTLQSYGDE